MLDTCIVTNLYRKAMHYQIGCVLCSLSVYFSYDLIRNDYFNKLDELSMFSLFIGANFTELSMLSLANRFSGANFSPKNTRLWLDLLISSR